VWLSSLKPQGVLLVETFAIGHGRLGRPRNPDFLLQPGELLQWTQAGLHVLAYEDGLLGSAEQADLRRVQRMAAIRPATTDVQAVGDWPLNPG